MWPQATGLSLMHSLAMNSIDINLMVHPSPRPMKAASHIVLASSSPTHRFDALHVQDMKMTIVIGKNSFCAVAL